MLRHCRCITVAVSTTVLYKQNTLPTRTHQTAAFSLDAARVPPQPGTLHDAHSLLAVSTLHPLRCNGWIHTINCSIVYASGKSCRGTATHVENTFIAMVCLTVHDYAKLAPLSSHPLPFPSTTTHSNPAKRPALSNRQRGWPVVPRSPLLHSETNRLHLLLAPELRPT